MHISKRPKSSAMAVVLVLAVPSLVVAVASAAAASAHPFQPDPVAVRVLDGVVVAAETDTVTIPFVNTGPTAMTPDTVEIGFEPPLPGSAEHGALTAAGIDPVGVGDATQETLSVDADGCELVEVAAGTACSLTLTATGTRPSAATLIYRTAAAPWDEIAKVMVVWLDPVASPTRPVNDAFTDATDLSTLAIPAFHDPLVTVAAVGDTTGATVEPGEFGSDPASTTNPVGATVWYRFTSPPGGFAGQLGYRVTPGFRVTALVAGEPDVLYPGSILPSTGPAAVDMLRSALGNDVWPLTHGALRYVRMEPGHTVYFQVAPAPAAPGGAFSLELYQAPNLQDDVAHAYDVLQGTPFAHDSAAGGDGTTYHVTPDTPGGTAMAWTTHVLDRAGRLTVGVHAQTPLGLPSREPVAIALFRAPTTDLVAHASALTPVADSAGGLRTIVRQVGGQLVPVEGWAAVLTDVPVTPGRYYIAYVRAGSTGTFFGSHAQFVADAPPPPTGTTPPPPDTTPPVVTITGAPSGTTAATAATLVATADEAIRSLSCTLTVATAGGGTDTTPLDCSAPYAGGTSRTIDLGGLPDGEVVVTVTATDLAGNTGSASAVWDVQAPPAVTIVAPVDGAAMYPADVPALAFTCTDNGTIGGEQVFVDGAPGGPALPTSAGAHRIEVRCTDVAGNTGSATAWYVVLVNQPPAAHDDVLSVEVGRTGTVDLLANDTDPEGGILRLQSWQRAPGAADPGSLACDQYTGRCTYTATAPGVDRYVYTVVDDRGATATGSLTVDVRPARVGDQVSIRLSGAITYQGAGTLWSGNVRVFRTGGTVMAISGGGNFVDNGVHANVQFNIFWSPVNGWTFGTVRVRVPSLRIDVTTPITSRPVVAADGTVSGTARSALITWSPFSVRPYVLEWSVRDVT